MSKQIRKAIIPVGGFGTRFLPATKATPKEMLTVVDKPIIQMVVEEAFSAGIDQFIFITGRNKTALEDHFDRKPELEFLLAEKGKTEILEKINPPYLKSGTISYIRQNEPKGLGHAINCARNFIGNEPFAVLLPDNIFLSPKPVMKQIVDAYTDGFLVGAYTVDKSTVNQYGVFKTASEKTEIGNLIAIDNIIQKPSIADAPSNLVDAGRYIFTPEIFNTLSKEKIGGSGEIELTDAITESIGKRPVNAFVFDGEWFDCGNKNDYLRANIEFSLTREDVKEKTIEILKTINKKYNIN
ncbi:MAG: UTP--glucose-1-phosphate uridylyltransferase [Rickettsiales bacterium]|jgi:UTP--glucose-1-phosphate uridylyltransferase|nr:UTP--glucose-1-phosphate uridylyltransferase [Rickettsiales bacterium]